MNAVLICGSRNPHGQTAQAGEAVLRGLARAGVASDKLFLPVLRLDRCRQCDDNGWGQCRREGHCVIADDLSRIADRLRSADVAVFATPVYYADLSESLRAFTDRLRRVCTHETGRLGIKGKPVVGVCVAGGGGGGALACCSSLERVLATSGFDVVDMIPVRRQNLQAKLAALEVTGQWLASRPGSGQ